jgi:hypothetical protein
MNVQLSDKLAALKRRAIAVGVAGGMGRAITCAICLLILFAWADLVAELSAGVRVAADVLALIALLVVLAMAALTALRSVVPAKLARRADEVAGSGGQILSGVDLAMTPPAIGGGGGAGGAGASAMTVGLAQMAIDRAVELISRVTPLAAIPTDRTRRALVMLGSLVLILIFSAIVAPRLISTQWLRFADPYGDHPPYSRLSFDVSPGAASVVYGKSFDVQVRTAGPNPERVELVYRAAGANDEVMAMFPQSDGVWQATLAGVTEVGEYFVRAGRARSHRYPVAVITVPKIEAVRFRITPPAYTNAAAYDGPLPQAGIAGLPGTKVELWAKSNRPLSAGAVKLAGDKMPATQPAVALAPPTSGASEVFGSFTITTGGTMSLAVTDVAGQSSTDSFVAPITLLADARPFVRVIEPKPESLATPDVSLNVQISAEDDYGISRLQLFRSLNDSTATAAELPVPKPPPVRLPAESPLKLADYGLKPGDVIKLYARAEDTDPAGAKGAESSVVTVRIISQEEMQKLMLARDAMEVLQSKYEQAARRLERLDAEMKKLQDEIAKREPGKPLDEQTRKALDKLAEMAVKDAAAMREMEKIDLPIDLDKALSKQLGELANKTDELSKEAKKASTQPSLSFAGANDKLAEMRKKLGVCRGEFQEETTTPIEHLAKIFPLIEDEARFLELYNRQRDLAERMASLKGQDNPDDPKLKSRMRDLGDEQKQLREALRQLLDDIDNHVAQLPADKRLDDLRDTATRFADAVRASEAAAEMNQAETALAEFAGTRSGANSKNAADILEKFIGRCSGMGDQASACLKFQPKLASGLGNSIQQLLDSMSMGSGMGGIGAGGGYSAQRTTLSNVGLYGNIPTRGQWAANSSGGQANRGISSDGRGGPDDNSDPSAVGSAGKTKTTGESDAAVPAQYRRRVGEYFQRVADELGEK